MESAFILSGTRAETQWGGEWATWPHKEDQAATPCYDASSFWYLPSRWQGQEWW